MKSKTIWQTQSVADDLRRQLTIYSPQELAQKLGISYRAVLAAIKSGRLTVNKVNSRVFHIESPEAARWWNSLRL